MQRLAASGVHIIQNVWFVYMIKADMESEIWESDC